MLDVEQKRQPMNRNHDFFSSAFFFCDEISCVLFLFWFYIFPPLILSKLHHNHSSSKCWNEFKCIVKMMIFETCIMKICIIINLNDFEIVSVRWTKCQRDQFQVANRYFKSRERSNMSRSDFNEWKRFDQFTIRTIFEKKQIWNVWFNEWTKKNQWIIIIFIHSVNNARHHICFTFYRQRMH